MRKRTGLLSATLIASTLVASTAVTACRPAAPLAAAPSPIATRAALRAGIDSLVADPMFRNTNWGVLILDPATGDTLYSRNAGKLFMPASNQKLLTGATALAQLGPDYRFATHFVSSGPVVDGVLRGDLLVFGRGDPSMSDAMMGDAMKPLRAAADSLRARGIREIAGALVKGGNAFPDTTLGFGWEWDDFDTPSGAAVDELFFNEGVARVTVFGGERPGDSVRVRTAPARTVPVVVADFATGAPVNGGPERRAPLGWTSDMRGARPVVHLGGSVGPRDSVSALVALRDPASAWLDAFAEALRDRGIALRGNVIRAPAAMTPDQPRLFTLWSPPLRELLPPFLKPSQNQMGELLFRALGLERTGVGLADSARRVVERQLVAWGADTAGFAVRDGSGMSRHDYVTPETIVKILDAMRRHESFRAFYDALPVAGVDGTIAGRMRGTPAQGNVHAKTGTLDKARSLSGYVTTADARMLVFSFLCNNFTVPNREVERVQDAILVRLAGGGLPR
jgi:D-alanyl-D-alanine carboxypeptidase/D-alanyl-D-alanine-endopeptidase (penicillin-binding protein 4)